MTTAPDDGKQQPSLHIVDSWQSFLPIGKPGPVTDTTPAQGVAELSRSERILLAAACLLAAAVSVLGLLSSFTALQTRAGNGPGGWGWSWPWVLPVSMDLAIPAFTLIGLLLIRVDMPLAWVAWVPRGLTAATAYLNWSAGRTLPGQIGHAVLTLLWVVFSEIAGHVYASRIGAVTGTRMERVRRIRWALAPISTLLLWRRMRLWESRSYAAVVNHQRDTAEFRARLRAQHGFRWRGKATANQRLALRLAKFGTPVADTLAAAALEVPVWVSEPVPNVVAPAPEPTPEAAPEPAPEPQVQTAPEPPAKPTRTTVRRTRRGTTGTKRNQRNQPESPAAGTNTTPSPTEQVRQVLNLIEEHGYEDVKLGFVIEKTGMSKTTAYNRLVEARAAWSENQA